MEQNCAIYSSSSSSNSSVFRFSKPFILVFKLRIWLLTDFNYVCNFSRER